MSPPPRKLKDLLRFSKPKTLGYDISKDYYLSVLAAVTNLPAPRDVLNPKGADGAVPGLLAPLGSTSKDDLARPMTRGVFAIASPNQKTILKLMVMPRDEAGFDPEPFLRSAIAEAFSEETRHRVAATWHLLQLTFEAFDPEIFPALDFFLLTARRLADLTGGVVADPICQRYLLPEEVICQPRRHEAFDGREHISIRPNPRRLGLHTVGLIKFALPEIEMPDLPDSYLELGELFLLNLSESILRGNLVTPGAMAGPFLVSHGGADLGQWEGIPVLELIPPPNSTVSEALNQWRTAAS